MRTTLKVLPLLAALALCSSAFGAPATPRRAGPRITRVRQSPPPPATPEPGGGAESGLPVLPSDHLLAPPSQGGGWGGHPSRVILALATARRSALRLPGLTIPEVSLQRAPLHPTRRNGGTLSVGFDGEAGLQVEGGYTFRMR